MEALTTISFADNYFKTKPNSQQWNDLTNDDKVIWLTEATRFVYSLQGFKYTPEVIELISVIPDDLQQACCEVTLGLMKYGADNVHTINQKLGITSISFGADSVSYSNNVVFDGLNNVVLSEYAQSILNKYIHKGVRYV